MAYIFVPPYNPNFVSIREFKKEDSGISWEKIIGEGKLPNLALKMSVSTSGTVSNPSTTTYNFNIIPAAELLADINDMSDLFRSE